MAEEQMKKLLILAYDFPPYVSVGGLRPYAWYRYLKEYGIEPIVVTRQWSNKYGDERDYIASGDYNNTMLEESAFGTIIRTPYKPNLANRLLLKYGKTRFVILRKAITAYYEFMQFVLFVGPKSCVYRGAKQYLKHNRVDAIIATGEPFVLFKYAAALAKKYQLPWFADYRDSWSPTGRGRQFLIGKTMPYFEHKSVSTATHIITVSNYVKHLIQQIVQNKNFSILPNGYNPEAAANVKNVQQNEHVLSFAFIGKIYSIYPYKSVLKQFDTFAKNNPDAKIAFDFFGVNLHSELEQLLNSDFPHLKNVVHIYPAMTNTELLTKLAEYSVMLLFNCYTDPGTKIYDYLALKRCILLCYSHDSEAESLRSRYYHSDEGFSEHLQEEIIADTQSGIVATDHAHLYRILEDLYAEFVQNGKIACNSVNVEKYSRKHQVKQLAELILSNVNVNADET